MQEVPQHQYVVDDQVFGEPHVTCEFVPVGSVVDQVPELGEVLSRAELEAKYPEALKAWEAGDIRPAVRSEIAFHLGHGLAASDGISDIVHAAETAAAYDLAEESLLYATLVKHREALREVLVVVHAEHTRTRALQRSREEAAS